MQEEKQEKPISGLHAVLRSCGDKVYQRRNDKLTITLVVILLVYCLVTIVSNHASPEYIQNIHWVGGSNDRMVVQQGQTSEVLPVTTTSPRPWSAGTTLRAARDRRQPHFRQAKTTVVVAIEGDDVQLDCRLAAEPHAIVTWYRDPDTFLTMGARTYIGDERISIHKDLVDMNWALRIRRAALSDAGSYSCHLALAQNDIVTTILDIVPADQNTTVDPENMFSPDLKTVGDIFTPGFEHMPPRSACPSMGDGVDAVILVTSHPLYVSTRMRVRKTWGIVNNHRNVVVVFGVGNISPAIMANITTEGEEFKDMVVGKYKDISIDPNVGTMKLLSLLQWVRDECPRARFALVVTHDMFVNHYKLKKVVKHLDADKPAIYGALVEQPKTSRDPASPSFLRYSYYRSSKLPNYSKGDAFLTTRAAISQLYDKTLSVKAIGLHDIIVTGFAAEAGNITRYNMEAVNSGEPIKVEACQYNEFISFPSLGPNLDATVYGKILNKTTC